MNTQTKILTLEQVCERVQLSSWAVRRAIKDGELDAMKLRGRLRVSDEAVAEWLRMGRIHPVVAGSPEVARPLPSRFPRSGGRFRRCLEDERAQA